MFVWGITRVLGGKVILRLEDHDRSRYRPAFEASILDDLDWLGFVPDFGDTEQFRTAVSSPYRQSDRGSCYASRLADLAAHGHIYACACSRKDIQARTGTSQGELAYDGHCASRDLGPGPGRALRVRLPHDTVRFKDVRHGAMEQIPHAQCGDLVVRDRHGHWTYQFAVVADDVAQGVNLVIRGDDLLASTGRQILLARLMGRRRPVVYCHHPLVTDDTGRKLSKREADCSITSARRDGVHAAAILGEAAYRVGLRTQPGTIEAQDVPSLFADLVD